ncbi:MAG: LapA family protein [Deltaproteobacteria bacterium]|nr:LapA family protein [Deltaproteobacteria bacterium]
MVKLAKAIFLTLLFILGITFATENTGWVVLRYYFGLETPPIPIFLLVLFSVLSGVFLAGVGFLIDERSLKKALREKEREITSLQKEMQPYREREQTMAGIATKE